VKKHVETALFVFIVAVVFGLILLIVMIQPIMESRTYNKLTGANTTAWDALWVELRVQDVPRKDPQ
jgi:hypothetical protein